MNDTPLLDQIRVYSEALVEDLPSQPFTFVDSVVPSSSTSRGRGWLVAAVAAVAVLIVIGGVGLLGLVIDDTEMAPVTDDPVVTSTQVTPTSMPDVEAEAEAPPTVDIVFDSATTPWLDVDLPPDAETGTLPTPLGIASWVRIPLEEDSPPGNQCLTVDEDDGYAGCRGGGVAVPWPSGFAIFQNSASFYPPPAPNSLPARLMVSPNGVEWREEPLPSDPAARSVSLTLDGDVYWLLSSNPDGLWRSTDGATWHEIDSSGLAPPTSVGPTWEGSHDAPVTAGDLTLSYAAFQGDEFPRDYDQRLYIIEDAGVTPVDVPWPQTFRAQGLFGAEEWIYAYVRQGQSDLPATVWGTTDGRSWTDLGPPNFINAETTSETTRFEVYDGRLVAYDVRGSQPNAWETTDGTNWIPAPTGRPDSTYPILLGSGWFTNDGSKGSFFDGDEWWMHMGDSWVSLDELGMQHDSQGCVVSATGTGNTTFFFRPNSCLPGSSDGEMWILHVE